MQSLDFLGAQRNSRVTPAEADIGVMAFGPQLDTHEDEIRSRFCHCCKRLLAVLGFRDFVIGAGEHIADDLAIIRLIFDHQNALAYLLAPLAAQLLPAV